MRYQSKTKRAFMRQLFLKYSVIAIGLLAIAVLIYMINNMPDTAF